MQRQPETSFERYGAERLARHRAAVARRWAERIDAPGSPGRLDGRPADEDLDTMAELLAHVAEFVSRGDEAVFRTDAVAERLAGYARDRRRADDLYEVIGELDVLAQVLDAACVEWIDDLGGDVPARSAVRVAGRLNRAAVLMSAVVARDFLERVDPLREQHGSRIRGFVDDLAHELRNPLAAAEMAAIALADDEIADSAHGRRTLAGLIQRSLHRARTTIDDMRALTLISVTERRSVRTAPIGAVLANVLVAVREVAEARGVRVEVEEPVPSLLVDAIRVEHILTNLVENAAKYSDPDRPDRLVRVQLTRDASDKTLWWVAVADNGLGISQEHRQRIFERHFRAHPERADGTGLGLAIVHEAAQQIGARLHLESEPGVGSTFRLALHAVEAVPHAGAPAHGHG